MQTRYGNLVKPGDNKPAAHTVVRYDEKTAGEYAVLLQKRGELSTRLRAGYNKQDAIVKEMGIAIAAGEDWKALAEQLSFLRIEEEALESGILYLDGQVGLMERLNNWLKG